MELQVFLRFVMTGGGAGLAAYWLIDNVPFLANLASKAKRLSAFAISALLADAAFIALAYAGYANIPVGALSWAEQLFAVGTSAFGLATLLHTKDLGRART